MRKLNVFLLASGLMVSAVSLARADSLVRIVRLSWVTGAVQVNLPDGNGWRPALLDAPLSEGEQVRTLGNGRAEIELEDGSTLRLIPNSEVDFAKLRLLDDGSRVTTAALTSGTVFVATRKNDSKDFQLTLPSGQAIVPNGDASFRAGLPTGDGAAAAARVQVLDGKASLMAAGSQIKLQKSEAATLASGETPVVAKDTAPPDAWQQWSDNRDHWYQEGLHSGVAAEKLDSYVNWYAETGAPGTPSYTGTSLAELSSSDCQWSLAGGWCWSEAQGWFLPTAAPALTISGGLASSPTVNVIAGGGYYDPCGGFYGGTPFVPFYGSPFGGWNSMYGWGGSNAWGGFNGFSGFGCSPFGYGFGYPYFGYPTFFYPAGGVIASPGAVPTQRPVLPVARGPHSPLPPPRYVPVAKPPASGEPKFGEKLEVNRSPRTGSVGQSSSASPRFTGPPAGMGHFAGPPPSSGRLVGPPPSPYSNTRSAGFSNGGVSHGVSASIGPPPSGVRFSAPSAGVASRGAGSGVASNSTARIGAVSAGVSVGGGVSRGSPSGGGMSSGAAASAASHSAAPSGGSSSAPASGAVHH